MTIWVYFNWELDASHKTADNSTNCTTDFKLHLAKLIFQLLILQKSTQFAVWEKYPIDEHFLPKKVAWAKVKTIQRAPLTTVRIWTLLSD